MKRALLGLLVGLAAAGCNGDVTTRNIEYMPEMIDSVAYDSFAPNPHTRDGKTLIAPAPGTIPRGYRPLHFRPGPAEAARAGRELRNPLQATKEVLARGKHVFTTFCAVCHGRSAEGDGTVVPPFPRPPSLKASHARKMPDGQMLHVITFGQGLMASYAAQVRRVDRWKVIHYIRSLQGAAPQGGAK